MDRKNKRIEEREDNMCGNFIRFMLPLLFLIMILGTTVVVSATEESVPNETQYKMLEEKGIPNDYLEGLPEITLNNLYDDIVIKNMQFFFQKEPKTTSLHQNNKQSGDIPAGDLNLFLSYVALYKPNDQLEKVYVVTSAVWRKGKPYMRSADFIAIRWDGDNFLMEDNTYSQEDFYVTMDNNHITQTRRTLPSQSNDGSIGYYTELAYSYSSIQLMQKMERMGSTCSFELIPRSPISRTSIEKAFSLNLEYSHNKNFIPIFPSFTYAGLRIGSIQR